jgi:nucleoporin NUP82
MLPFISTLVSLSGVHRSIPSSYIHALECFVVAKQEYLSQNPSSESQSLSTTYSYQHKYISALVKQLPPGTVFPAASRSVLLHPPTTMKTPPLRQGPFLLQPAPLTLDGSEDGDATDILYLSFDHDDETDDDGETERLGVVLVVTKDGKVDVCLDVDKVEARWETRQVSVRCSTNRQGLDFFAVPEHRTTHACSI